MLPTDAILGGRPFRPVLRDENLDSTEPARFFSLLRRLARSEPVADMSWIVVTSMNAWGKMPHLPLEFVPDQHQ